MQSVAIKAMDFDTEVPFNSEKTYNSWDQTMSSQRMLNNKVCRITKGYDAVALGVVEHGDAESVNAMGIAINGVAFQFANQIMDDPGR